MSARRTSESVGLDVREILESALGLEVIKEGGDGRELNVACPFCGDDKPNHMYVNAESGQWTCHKCGDRGSLAGLTKRLLEMGAISKEAGSSVLARVDRCAADARRTSVRKVLSARLRVVSGVSGVAKAGSDPDVPLLAKVALALHEDLTEAHRRDLRAWLSNATIDRFRPGAVSVDLPSRLRALDVDLERCAELGILKRRATDYVARHVGAITVPTFVDGGVSNIEHRMPEGRKPRKLSLKGRSRELFNVTAVLPGERVYLTEGASDAMVLVDRGFAAVGAPSATTFRPEWVELLSHSAEVVLVFDNDEPGRKGARRVRDMLLGHGVIVRDVLLPSSHDGSAVKDVRDFLATAKADRDDLLKLVDGTSTVVPMHPSRPPTSRSRTRPTVRVDGQLRVAVSDAEQILLASAEELELFNRGGKLARLRPTSTGIEIEPVSVSRLTYLAADRIDWIRGDAEADAKPLEQVIRVLGDTLPEKLPELEAVAGAPFFDCSGDLVASAGYHAPTRTFFYPSQPWQVRRLERHSRLVVRSAVDRLRDLLTDFPFQDEADVAHAMALLILPFIRRMIDGPTPLHVVEAPGPGTGKTLLTNLVSIVATGQSAEAITLHPREEEIGKLIGAELSRGRPLIVFDNFDHDHRRSHFGSAALASALTAKVVASRRLGTSEMMELPNRAAWVMTGNNPTLSRELARRAVRIRIDARSDQPWRRDGFRHRDILRWTHENRRGLALAVIRLVEAWVLAGGPKGASKIGSMEAWAETLGGILDVAGVPGFLGNLDDFYQEADAETNEWKQLFEIWGAERADDVMKTSEINALCATHCLLEAVRGDGSEHSQVTRLANVLIKQRGQVHAGWRLTVVRDGRSHGKTYQLQRPTASSEKP